MRGPRGPSAPEPKQAKGGSEGSVLRAPQTGHAGFAAALGGGLPVLGARRAWLLTLEQDEVPPLRFDNTTTNCTLSLTTKQTQHAICIVKAATLQIPAKLVPLVLAAACAQWDRTSQAQHLYRVAREGLQHMLLLYPPRNYECAGLKI